MAGSIACAPNIIDAGKQVVTDVAKQGAQQALVDLFKSASKAANDLMRWVMTAWMNPALDPKLAHSDGAATGLL